MFESAAPYYAKYRPSYAPEMYPYLAERLHLDGTGHALDLGAGTGLISLPLAPLVGEVIAVEPEPAMLAQGLHAAEEQGIANITWRIGDSTGLRTMHLPPLRLVTMGKSFHWMDRGQTLRDLDQLVTPDGAVVIVFDGAPGTRQPDPWETVVAVVRCRYLGSDRGTGTGADRSQMEGHREMLARSPFSRTEVVHWEHQVPRTLDEVVGLQLSYSLSTPAMLGPDLPAFEADLRQALTSYQPDGRFTERVRTELIIATRP